QGPDGKPAIYTTVTNQNIALNAPYQGLPSDYSKANGNIQVFEGDKEVTPQATYTLKQTLNVAAELDFNKFKVTHVSADNGMFIVTVSYKEFVSDIMITTNVVRNGQSGQQGPPTGIIESPTIPTDVYQGMLWKNTGNLTGFITDVTYIYRGSKWEKYIFTADNIYADNLAAITANLGTITAGEILTSFFRGDSISSAIKKRGTTSISDGQFRSSFDYVQVSNNTILGKGDVVLDENGFMIRDLSTKNEVLRSVSYKPDKIIMTDINFGYGEVNLKYQDLLSLPQVPLEGVNGWERYATTGGSAPMAERNMRTVTLVGAFKPISTVSHTGLEMFTICILPVGYRPKERYTTVAAGSGIRLALINVEANGAVTISRNRDNNGYVNYNAGGWYSIACSFSAADI
ncbi:MAG: hypothetical protein RR929_00250, partial [Erysipelotrichaceae bacterium]